MVSRKAFQFFLERSGYVVGKRAIGALALARAERQAQERGIKFVWEWDDDPDLGDHGYWCATERKRLAQAEGRPVDNPPVRGWAHRHSESVCDHEVLYCSARSPDGKILAGLGGIIDPDRDYRRVIEAELAVEALEGICEIQWIDKEGNPTPDTCPAIGEVYLATHSETAPNGHVYQIRGSRPYRICAEHARQALGLQHWHLREY